MVDTKGYPFKTNGIHLFIILFMFNAGEKKNAVTKPSLIIYITLDEEYRLWNI